MATSVLIRMAVGLLVFVLMARGLGPVTYGLFATVFAYATLASLLTDFGFGSKTLRDIGADPENGESILNNSLSVKAYLTVGVLLVGGLAIAIMPGPLVSRIAAAILGAAVLIGGIGDLALTAYRATGRYAGEAWIMLWTSTIHLAIVGWISLAHGEPLILAVAFIVSRSAYTVISVHGAMRLFSRLGFRPQSLREVCASARGSWSWAADSGLNYFNGQIDGLFVASAFGLQAAGIYQSGARFIQAALGLVAILAAVHIPRVARLAPQAARMSAEEWRMIIEFSVSGAILGLAFALGGPLITRFFLGSEYIAVNSLWLGFSAFVVLRYVAASLGAALSARGLPLTRVVGQLVAVAIVVLGFCFVAPSWGLASVPWIMSAGAFATLIAYAAARILVARGVLRRAADTEPARKSEI